MHRTNFVVSVLIGVACATDIPLPRSVVELLCKKIIANQNQISEFKCEDGQGDFYEYMFVGPNYKISWKAVIANMARYALVPISSQNTTLRLDVDVLRVRRHMLHSRDNGSDKGFYYLKLLLATLHECILMHQVLDINIFHNLEYLVKNKYLSRFTGNDEGVLNNYNSDLQSLQGAESDNQQVSVVSRNSVAIEMREFNRQNGSVLHSPARQ